MKKRTDLILTAVFLVGLLLYILLIFSFFKHDGPYSTSPIYFYLTQLRLWLALGGHVVPFFALQLLMCRRLGGRSKYLAGWPTALTVGLLLVFAVSFITAAGWDMLGWGILMLGTIAPVVGCLLAWTVWEVSCWRKRNTPCL